MRTRRILVVDDSCVASEVLALHPNVDGFDVRRAAKRQPDLETYLECDLNGFPAAEVDLRAAGEDSRGPRRPGLPDGGQ